MPNCPGAKLSGAQLPIFSYLDAKLSVCFLGAKLSAFTILVPICLGAKLSAPGAKLSYPINARNIEDIL